MTWLTNGRRILSLADWSERMDVSIEDFCVIEEYETIEITDLISEPDPKNLILENGIYRYDVIKHTSHISEYDVRLELSQIFQWFEDNQWKNFKIITGEWLVDDQRWIDYLEERVVKRQRRDYLNTLIGFTE